MESIITKKTLPSTEQNNILQGILQGTSTIGQSDYLSTNYDIPLYASRYRLGCAACRKTLSKRYWKAHIETIRHISNKKLMSSGLYCTYPRPSDLWTEDSQMSRCTTTNDFPDARPSLSTASTVLNPRTLLESMTIKTEQHGEGRENTDNLNAIGTVPMTPPPIYNLKERFRDVSYTLENDLKLLRSLVDQLQ